MRDVAKVVSVTEKNAVVCIEKKDECSKCGMCLFPKNVNSVKLKAENKAKASVGDLVIVESSEKAMLISSLLVFLVPLILVGISAFVNYLFIKKEISILILSVILIVLWYTILAVIDKKLSRKSGFKPVITEILKENNK